MPGHMVVLFSDSLHNHMSQGAYCGLVSVVLYSQGNDTRVYMVAARHKHHDSHEQVSDTKGVWGPHISDIWPSCFAQGRLFRLALM